MDRYLNFIEDKKFVRWVYSPDAELNDYWDNYQQQHPEDIRAIKTASLLLSQLRTVREPVDPSTTIELYAGIAHRLETSRKKRNPFILTLARYAAVALVFFALGVLLYSRYEPGSVFTYLPPVYEQDFHDDARIILGDGNKIAVTGKESVVEYRRDGGIVLNTKDTIHSKATPKTGPELNQLVVPYGRTSAITLPDGTMVFLNAGSRLIYPSFFQGKSREVVLFGEGYFQVAHLADKPFIVKTSELNVEVLGTSFNVSAYPSDKNIETVLVSGKVKVWEAGSSRLFRKEYMLVPGELASFSRETSETAIRKVDVSNYVSWHEGFMNFESADLSRIVKRLERYYNITLQLDQPMLGLLKISGKLKLNEDMTEVLSVVANTASLELVKINDRQFILK